MSRIAVAFIAASFVTSALAQAQETPQETVDPQVSPVPPALPPGEPLADPRPARVAVMPVERRMGVGMPDNAFLVELRLGGGGAVGTNVGSVGLLQPSLTIGARLGGRIHLGVGLALVHISTSSVTTGMVVSQGTELTASTLEPTLSISRVHTIAASRSI